MLVTGEVIAQEKMVNFKMGYFKDLLTVRRQQKGVILTYQKWKQFIKITKHSKTKYEKICRDLFKHKPNCGYTINGRNIEEVNSFAYLGAVIYTKKKL